MNVQAIYFLTLFHPHLEAFDLKKRLKSLVCNLQGDSLLFKHLPKRMALK
jgi:hypothetical protein